MSRINVELVTPEELLFSDEADVAVIPGAEGDFGVLEGHSPMISSLRPGVININISSGKDRNIFVSGGFAEVTPGRCTILAEEAFDLAETTLAEAKDKLASAEYALKNSSIKDDIASLERNIAVAKWLLEALEK